MRILVSTLLLLLVAGTLPAQSLVQLAQKEKERRRSLKEKQPVEASKYGERSLHLVRHGRPAETEAKRPESEAPTDKRGEAAPAAPVPLASLIDDSTPEARKTVETQSSRQNDRKPLSNGKAVAVAPVPLVSPVAEEAPQAGKKVEIQRSRGRDPQVTPGEKTIAATAGLVRAASKASVSDRMFDGALYVDWFRAAHDDGFSSSQASTRFRLVTGNRPGRGWRFLVDARHRYNGSSSTTNKLIVYDARALYDDASRRLSLSLGQMNLYEAAGVGQLAGGVVGVKMNPSWTLGGYGGLEPDIYELSYDLSYLKYGAFAQYRGPNARSLALSYNRLTYESATERQFLYGSGLLPVGAAAVVYGSAEFELGHGISGGDRLSHLFLNTRYSFSPAADVTGYYSSGRGLDYHRFLVEQSQDPDRNSAELERFYYTESYGARFSLKPWRQVRVFVAQRESTQKDQGIRNHTTQIGASTWDLGGSGIGLYGTYNINRGDASESDSYRVSVSRDFGPVAWTGYFSSTFNGVRFDAATGRPEIFHLPDQRTFSNDFFFDLSDAFAVAVEHDLSRRGQEHENSLFFRMMLRF